MLGKCQENRGLVTFVSKLVEAEKRLQRAILQLEQAAERYDKGPIDKDLDTAADGTEELKAVHRSVAERLDETILRLRQVLER